MAVKEYGYYVKGNKFALVEKDTRFDNDINSKDYGPGTDRVQWKSPLSTVADGIEIQYVYSPKYFIKSTTNSSNAMTHYSGSTDGFLKLYDGVSSYTDWDSHLDVGDSFVLKNAGQFNGLHKVSAFATTSSSNDTIITTTKYSGITTPTAFEKTTTLYYQVDALDNDDSVLDIPDYLSRALVNYVKARMLEDQLNLEGKEYFMAEFRKMIEKYNNTRIAGIRKIAPGSHAIR